MANSILFYLIIIYCLIAVYGSFVPSNTQPILNDILNVSNAIPGPLGVNIHWTTPQAGELQMLKAGGFGFIRMDFNWDATEPQKGVYDFSQYDILMSNLNSVGIRALLILDYTNSLYDDGKPVYDDVGRMAMAYWAANATVHFKRARYIMGNVE